MRKLFSRLWSDDCGALIATEWVFVATILVLGSITGLVALRQAILNELLDMANAVMSLDQSYSFTGQRNCESSTAGSVYVDDIDRIVEFHTDPRFVLDTNTLPCD